MVLFGEFSSFVCFASRREGKKGKEDGRTRGSDLGDSGNGWAQNGLGF